MSDVYETLSSGGLVEARAALRRLLAGLLVDPDRVSPALVREYRALLAELADAADAESDALERLFAAVGDPTQPVASD